MWSCNSSPLYAAADAATEKPAAEPKDAANTATATAHVAAVDAEAVADAAVGDAVDAAASDTLAAAAAADAQAMAGDTAAAAETWAVADATAAAVGDPAADAATNDDDDNNNNNNNNSTYKPTEHPLKNFQFQISNINSHQNQLMEREHVAGCHHCVHLCTLQNQLLSGYSKTDNLSRHRFQFEPHSWSATVIN